MKERLFFSSLNGRLVKARVASAMSNAKNVNIVHVAQEIELKPPIFDLSDEGLSILDVLLEKFMCVYDEECSTRLAA